MSVVTLTFSDEQDALIGEYGINVGRVARAAVIQAVQAAAAEQLGDKASRQRRTRLREIADVLGT